MQQLLHFAWGKCSVGGNEVCEVHARRRERRPNCRIAAAFLPDHLCGKVKELFSLAKQGLQEGDHSVGLRIFQPVDAMLVVS